MSSGACDVGFGEVVSDVEERIAGKAGDGVRQAISEIQSGGVVASTKTEEGSGGGPGMVFIEGDDSGSKLPEESLNNGAGVLPQTRGEDHASLNYGWSTDQNFIGLVETSQQPFVAGLPENDGNDCRSIENQTFHGGIRTLPGRSRG